MPHHPPPMQFNKTFSFSLVILILNLFLRGEEALNFEESLGRRDM
jgi:hypothetical protein